MENHIILTRSDIDEETKKKLLDGGIKSGGTYRKILTALGRFDI